jgi:septal ring factor EnvC (AmiA/AmiB activator)
MRLRGDPGSYQIDGNDNSRPGGAFLPAARRPPNQERLPMSRASKALIVLVVASTGLWGCAQGPASVERLKALEAKCAKLEEDGKAAADARDAAKKRVAALEEERTKLKKDLEERTIQLTTRTNERDRLQGQFEQVRKGLKDLLGQSEAALGTQTPPTTAVADATPGGNS